MNFHTWSAIAGAICLLGGHAVAQTKWTVAPTGPADFNSIGAAVSAVAEGDILLLAPGDYGSVTISKALTLLGSQDGASRPRFNDLRILNSPWVELYHLEVQGLTVENVPRRSRIEDVVTTGRAILTSTGELFMRGCTIRGADGVDQFAVAGLTLSTTFGSGPARVQIVDSTIRGGDAFGEVFPGIAGPPGTGINVTLSASSRLTLIGCDVIGGSRGDNVFFPIAGVALGSVFNAGVVEVRGSSFHGLRGGSLGPGLPLGGGAAYGGEQSTTALVLGDNVEVLGSLVGSVDLVPARPYAQWTGTGGPGSTRTFEVFGPAGDLAVAFFGFGTTYDLSSLAAFGSVLTVDLNTLLLQDSGVLQGQDTALGFGFSVPPTPALVGQALPSQAAVLRMSDFSLSLTNGDDLLISF